MSEPIYLATIGIFFGTVFMIFLVRAVATIKTARLQAEHEAAYRVIVERVMAAQETTAAALADLQLRIVAIEKMLKEVE